MGDYLSMLGDVLADKQQKEGMPPRSDSSRDLARMLDEIQALERTF